MEAEAGRVGGLVAGLPWRGVRRDAATGSARVAAGVARGQAEAERDLAMALRELAFAVERELRVLDELAARARRHLEDLLRRATALVEATAQAAADAAATGVRVAFDVLTFDPAGAVREARRLAEAAGDRLLEITHRLQTLPVPYDPVWHQLGPQLLAWRPV